MINKERMLKNFISFVKINTQSFHDKPATPSSLGQFELAKIVQKKWEEIGLEDIKLTEECFLFGTLPNNFSKKTPIIGFVAHFDTTPEVPGKDVKPNIIRNYKGQKMVFSGNPDLVLDPSKDENLKSCINHTIITSDGTTLLGGDDKAGIAAIIEVAQYLKDHPEVKHGKIRFGIMPDEETGCGTDKLDLSELGADVIYTLDGSFLGDVDVESFNGFKSKISVIGNAAFPGYGKGIYLSATKVLAEFVTLMSDDMWPENCDKRQPIWWADEFKGGVGNAEMTVFLRNFDLSGIEKQKKMLEQVKEKLLKKYPEAKMNIETVEMYKNFKNELDKDKRVFEYAKEAMKGCGVTPNPIYVRGGSDACHFCFKGIISTNIFIGLQQMHSLKEWISLEIMEKSAETAISLAKIWAEKS